MQPGSIAQRDASRSSPLLRPSGRSGGCRSRGQTASAVRHGEGEGWGEHTTPLGGAAAPNQAPEPLPRRLCLPRAPLNLISRHGRLISRILPSSEQFWGSGHLCGQGPSIPPPDSGRDPQRGQQTYVARVQGANNSASFQSHAKIRYYPPLPLKSTFPG